MSITKKDYLIVFFGGFLLGIISFIFVYGFKVLNFTYDAWLLQGTGYTGDLTQHYLGWVFLRDSKWSFPLGLIEGLAYPDKVSIIYTDSIPLFAIFFKIISPILPKTFQYFGLWGILCFALQGGIAAIIIRKFTKSRIICFVSSLFFIFSPIMLKRMFFHTALAAHWIILLALCIWVYREHFKSTKRKLLVWCGIMALSVLSNIYFTPIVLGIMLCSFLQDLIENKELLSSIITFFSSTIMSLLIMYLFGAFYGEINSKMGGLGVFSFNLNGLYNPLGNSCFLLSQTLAGAGQGEGYSYLGLGMILTIVVSCFFRFSAKKSHQINKGRLVSSIPYAVAIIVFSILAISPVVTFNDKTLFSISYPQPILDSLSIFRSSGRFIWPVYYMIFFFALSTILKYSKEIVSIIGLSAFAIIQLIDMKNVIISNHNFFAKELTYESTLKSEQWSVFANKYKHIMFYAPLWDLYVNPDVAYNFAVFADENGMTLNGTYFSRDLSDQINASTFSHFEELKKGNLPDDTLYIFPTSIPEGYYGLKYYTIDGYKVGIRK